MLQKFNYNPRYQLSDSLWEIIVAVIVIALPLVWPFSISLAGFTILPYPWTIALCLIAGVAVLRMALAQYKNTEKLKNHDCTIVLTDQTLRFKRLVKGKVKETVVATANINSAEIEDGDLNIYVNGQGSYSFDKRYFENEEEFDRFQASLSK